MRDALLGKPQGSVPSVRPGAPPAASPWRTTTVQPGGYAGAQQAPGYGAQPRLWRGSAAAGSAGGSFLGTAAATAAGVIGGALLMNSFRGMFGGAQGQGHSAFDSGGRRQARRGAAMPRGGDLAREAGLDDIGRGGAPAGYDERLAARWPVRLGAATATAISMTATIDVGGDFGGDGGSDTA